MTNIDSTSKFLSLILRHQPETIGLKLDSEGWADVSELLKLSNLNGKEIDHDLLKIVVDTNIKRRFSFNKDGSRIRANQGHSVVVDLGLSPMIPPDVLYHGTATRSIESIRQKGLIPGSRQHVHLSADEATAIVVGRRHGKPCVLSINALKMHENDHQFFISENGVLLTLSVPVEFITFENKIDT